MGIIGKDCAQGTVKKESSIEGTAIELRAYLSGMKSDLNDFLGTQEENKPTPDCPIKHPLNSVINILDEAMGIAGNIKSVISGMMHQIRG